MCEERSLCMTEEDDIRYYHFLSVQTSLPESFPSVKVRYFLLIPDPPLGLTSDSARMSTINTFQTLVIVRDSKVNFLKPPWSHPQNSDWLSWSQMALGTQFIHVILEWLLWQTLLQLVFCFLSVLSVAVLHLLPHYGLRDTACCFLQNCEGGGESEWRR